MPSAIIHKTRAVTPYSKECILDLRLIYKAATEAMIKIQTAILRIFGRIFSVFFNLCVLYVSTKANKKQLFLI